MGGKLPSEITDFMKNYGVTSDELWEVRNGTYAIKHKALERVALVQKITFDPPIIIAIDLREKMVALSVTGRQGDRYEWSTGEAAPYNNKNGYPVAMAEKRARDRVTLKLLNIYGTLYSDEEADDFKRPNPHVTRPEDIVPTVEYDDNGQPLDNIPLGDERITQLPKSKARIEYASLQSEMRKNNTADELHTWGAANKDRVASLPSDWQDILRGQFTDHLATLVMGKPA